MGSLRRRALITALSTPPEFTPGHIEGLVLDLDYRYGVYTDTAMATPAAVGQTVKGWQDRSGNGYHATEATNPPLLAADGLQFDGVNDVLRVARMTGQFGGGYTIFFTAFFADGRPSTIKVPFGALQASPSRGYWDMLLFTGGTHRMAVYENGTAVQFQFANIFGDGLTPRFVCSNTATPGGNLVGYFNGAVNGGAVSLAGLTWSNIATAITESPFIGARNASGSVDSPTAVTVQSILIYNRPLSLGELTIVHRYIGHAHGIAVP